LKSKSIEILFETKSSLAKSLSRTNWKCYSRSTILYKWYHPISNLRCWSTTIWSKRTKTDS